MLREGIEMTDWNHSGLPKAHPYQLIDFLQHIEYEKGEDITVADLLNAFAQVLYDEVNAKLEEE